jgi:hypothetical protein
MIFHQLSGDMEITFKILFCAYWIIIFLRILVKAATHRKCGKALTNILRKMYKWSSTKKSISEYRNSDFQISGFAISSHKNIQEGGNAVALLTDDNAGLVQIAGAVFTVICAMLYYIYRV